MKTLDSIIPVVTLGEKKTVLLAWKRRHHPNRYFSLVINVEIERDIKMTITAVARGQKCVTGKNAD